MKQHSGKKNGAANRTAKTAGGKLLAELDKHGISIDEVKGELDKLAKTSKAPQLQPLMADSVFRPESLKVLYKFQARFPEDGNTLLADERQQLWLAYVLEGGHEDEIFHEGKVIPFSEVSYDQLHHVSIAGALAWYAKYTKVTTDASGDLVALCQLAARQLRIDDMRNKYLTEKQDTADKRRCAEAEMKVKVSAFAMGMFAEAGVVNNCTPEEALHHYVNSGDTMCDWANNGFLID